MDYRTAHLRRFHAGTRLKKRMAAVGMMGVAAGVAALLSLGDPPQHAVHATLADAVPVAPVARTTAAAPAAPARARTRRVYPFSIVPGGVADRAELAQVLRTDRVVAVHYAAFEVRNTHAVTVSKPRAVYVSYRKGDKVYWTSKKVMLAEGETLLSDGSNEIRSRCGNRISDVAQLPVAADEPSAQVLDTSMEMDQDPADGGVQAASTTAGDPGTPAAAAQTFPLTTFANGAGLLPGGHTGAGLALLGMTPLPGGGFDRARNIGPAYALPLLQVGSQAGQAGGAAGSPASASDSAGTLHVASGTSGGASGTTGSAGAAPSTAGTGSTGAASGTDTSSTNPAAPVFGSDTEVADSKPELPPLPGALSPTPTDPVTSGKVAQQQGEVPEPDTVSLCGAALAAAWLVLRRRSARRS